MNLNEQVHMFDNKSTFERLMRALLCCTLLRKVQNRVGLDNLVYYDYELLLAAQRIRGDRTEDTER